jgi:hypothetical protein
VKKAQPEAFFNDSSGSVLRGLSPAHACLPHLWCESMSAKKPAPLSTPDVQPRRVCSVCGKVTYSRGGIHPQCAEEQADADRVAKLKAEQKIAKPPEKPAQSQSLDRWQKLCPKCRKKIHVRKLTCDCGHQF